MLKTIPYKKDENFVDITGTIQNLPDYCKYVNLPHTRPLISFDLLSNRKRKTETEELQYDLNRIVLFDDEDFNTNFKEGDRIRIKGEIQSRNYTRDNHEIDEFYVMAVKNYVDLHEEIPAIKEPVGKFKQPVDWSMLLASGLIPEIPSDSMYDETGTKKKTRDNPFVYRVDENGDLTKESEHVAYEILVRKYEKLEEEVDPLLGDKNKAVLVGKLTKSLYFNFLGQENKVPFCSFNIQTKSKIFENKVFYNNIIAWSGLAEDAFNDLTGDDYIKVVGRIQSRSYEKELTKRWTTPSGRRKKKITTIELMTREISASKIQKCILPEKEDDTDTLSD